MASVRGLWSAAQSLAGGPLVESRSSMFSLSINDSNAGAEASWVSLLTQPGWEEQPIPQCAVQPCRRASTGWREGTCPTALSGSCSIVNGQNWALCSCHWGRADEAAWHEHGLGPSLCTGPNSWRASARKGRPHSPTSVSETEKPQFMLIFYTLNATNRLQQHRQPTRIKRFGPWGFFPKKTMITLW